MIDHDWLFSAGIAPLIFGPFEDDMPAQFAIATGLVVGSSPVEVQKTPLISYPSPPYSVTVNAGLTIVQGFVYGVGQFIDTVHWLGEGQNQAGVIGSINSGGSLGARTYAVVANGDGTVSLKMSIASGTAHVNATSMMA